MEWLISALSGLILLAVLVYSVRMSRITEQRLSWMLLAMAAAAAALGTVFDALSSQPRGILSAGAGLLASALLLAAACLLASYLKNLQQRKDLLSESELRTEGIAELSHRILDGEPEQAIVESANALLRQRLGVDFALVFERPSGSGHLIAQSQFGLNKAQREEFDLGDPLAALLLALSKAQELENPPEGADSSLRDFLAKLGAEVSAAAPIGPREGDQVVLSVHFKDPRRLSSEDMVFLERIGEMLGRARSREEVVDVSQGLELIREGTCDLSIAFDSSQSILYLNARGRELLSVPPDEQPPSRLQAVFASWAWQRLQDEAIPQADEAGFWCGESAAVSLEGRDIPLALVVLSHKDSGGRTVLYSSFAFDLSVHPRLPQLARADADHLQRLQDLHKRLETADVAVQELAQATGRTLQEPLGAVASFARTLLDKHGEQIGPHAERYVQLISEAAQSAAVIAVRLHHVARQGRQPLKLVPVDMEKLAREAFSKVLSKQGGGETGEIEFSLQPLLPTKGDPSLLGRVLMNLIGNAVKFSKSSEPPVIEVGSRAQDGRIVYYVRDNGTGFDMADSQRLFAPFFKLHGDEYPGSGMGLYQVKRIVQRHGGEVWAQGEPGLGATFNFTLPAATD